MSQVRHICRTVYLRSSMAYSSNTLPCPRCLRLPAWTTTFLPTLLPTINAQSIPLPLILLLLPTPTATFLPTCMLHRKFYFLNFVQIQTVTVLPCQTSLNLHLTSMVVMRAICWLTRIPIPPRNSFFEDSCSDIFLTPDANWFPSNKFNSSLLDVKLSSHLTFTQHENYPFSKTNFTAITSQLRQLENMEYNTKNFKGEHLSVVNKDSTIKIVHPLFTVRSLFLLL